MKKKAVITLLIYTISAICTLSSLYFNAQTIPIIKQTTVLTKKNAKLRLENQRLQNKISAQSSLQNIQKKAEEYKMILPRPNKVTHVGYSK